MSPNDERFKLRQSSRKATRQEQTSIPKKIKLDTEQLVAATENPQGIQKL